MQPVVCSWGHTGITVLFVKLPGHCIRFSPIFLYFSWTNPQTPFPGLALQQGLLLAHLFAVEVVEPVREHLVDAVGVREGDEAEAPAPLRGRVLHHHHLRDVAELAEVLLQALCNNGEEETISESDLFRLARSFVYMYEL